MKDDRVLFLAAAIGMFICGFFGLYIGHTTGKALGMQKGAEMVYKGKTALKYTITISDTVQINNIKIDSCAIFK